MPFLFFFRFSFLPLALFAGLFFRVCFLRLPCLFFFVFPSTYSFCWLVLSCLLSALAFSFACFLSLACSACYTTLHRITLHCIATGPVTTDQGALVVSPSSHTTPHHTTLHCTTTHHTLLHLTTLHHTLLHHTTPHNNTPHHNTIHQTTLHHTTLHCHRPSNHQPRRFGS